MGWGAEVDSRDHGISAGARPPAPARRPTGHSPLLPVDGCSGVRQGDGLPDLEGGTSAGRRAGPALEADRSVSKGAGDVALHEPHVLRLALRVRLAAADRHQHPVAAAAAATSAHRRALTSLRRIPAMKRSPAITASRRPRSTATSSDSTPRTRRRGLDAADSPPRRRRPRSPAGR